MLPGFEEITKPLTDYEKDKVLPRVVQGLRQYAVGKDNAITNKTIVAKLKKEGFKVDLPRIRKIINHIRCNGLVKRLVATSKGYHISNSIVEMNTYITSLEMREAAIRQVRLSITRHRDEFVSRNYQKELFDGRN